MRFSLFMVFTVFCFPVIASQIKNPKIKLLHGKFTVPYFLTNGHQGMMSKGESFIYIVNARGQIVWEFFSNHNPVSNDIRTRSLIVKPLPGGRYGILHPYEASFFEVVDKEKRVSVQINLKAVQKPTVLHHDFILKDNQKIISIGNSRHHYRKWWKFWAPLNSFLGSPILEVDLIKNYVGSLWDSLSTINPFQSADWKFSEKDSGAFFETWDQSSVENDFEHTNSIQELSGGELVLSLRSQNRVVVLDPKSQQVKWSVGPSVQNTYQTKGTSAEFYRQHHATLLKDGNLMLFDNGKKHSRILIIKKNENTKKAELVLEYLPQPPIFSEKHGSVFESDNGNILAYFPNTKPNQNGPNYILEFDGKSGQELARLSLDVGNNRVGYRAIPLKEY